MVFLKRSSCSPRGWLDVADGVDDLSEDRAADCDFGQLEGDLAGVAHHTCADFDEAALDACQ